MFRKKARELQEDPDVQVMRGAAEGATTIIGEGVVMDGNITGGRDADIYGHVTGDIILPEGTVRIMPEGYINGNITAASIMISGMVEGCCEGHSVTVLAQGRFSGVCRSAAFSITAGGVFTGTSEPWPDKAEPACLNTEKISPSAERGGNLMPDVRGLIIMKEEEEQ
ncbi:TPA: polymer-forming cytoskeletal protein [Salmonella enterica subsp. salamae serovar 21:z10:z6]